MREQLFQAHPDQSFSLVRCRNMEDLDQCAPFGRKNGCGLLFYFLRCYEAKHLVPEIPTMTNPLKITGTWSWSGSPPIFKGIWWRLSDFAVTKIAGVKGTKFSPDLVQVGVWVWIKLKPRLVHLQYIQCIFDEEPAASPWLQCVRWRTETSAPRCLQSVQIPHMIRRIKSNGVWISTDLPGFFYVAILTDCIIFTSYIPSALFKSERLLTYNVMEANLSPSFLSELHSFVALTWLKDQMNVNRMFLLCFVKLLFYYFFVYFITTQIRWAQVTAEQQQLHETQPSVPHCSWQFSHAASSVMWSAAPT